MTKKPLVDLNDHPSHDWKGLEHMHQRPGTDNDGPQSLSCVRLFGTPWTVAGRGSSVDGILQARILGWVAISSSRGLSQPRD